MMIRWLCLLISSGLIQVLLKLIWPVCDQSSERDGLTSSWSSFGFQTKCKVKSANDWVYGCCLILIHADYCSVLFSSSAWYWTHILCAMPSHLSSVNAFFAAPWRFQCQISHLWYLCSRLYVLSLINKIKNLIRIIQSDEVMYGSESGCKLCLYIHAIVKSNHGNRKLVLQDPEYPFDDVVNARMV